MSGRPAPARRQAGAALLTAMIIVALVATLASGMVWQQWRTLQVEQAERGQAQAAWVLQGALDWTLLILREDARTKGSAAAVDHLGEPWAVPLAEARLSTFLAADRDHSDDAPDAFLSGAISDAQARYNLRNVVQQGKVVPAELLTLQRLCRQVGLAEDTADRLASALRRAQPASGGQDSDGGSETPLMPERAEQLGWLGLDPLSLQLLLPQVTLLPVATPVNLNTASREVLAAVLVGSDLAGVDRLIQHRRSDPLRNIGDATPLLGAQVSPDPARTSVSTQYFEVVGALRTEDLVVTQRSLIERRDMNNLRILRTERIAPERVASPGFQP
ncbi:type II secretion system protein K (GspK) [Sphaerotilus hippei]|uniref:Type II secretion system protein K n=1 Tax=Sphaerotilus hippei TaxID=744406 RepID=A0A318H9Z0_9BURK|nr:type II secretion system minor pseudopilin GspK [Sphaerotilus hippei]PXW97107.1 type II secretion system protein K (GspK) [Sphaerotilus hippei]